MTITKEQLAGIYIAFSVLCYLVASPPSPLGRWALIALGVASTVNGFLILSKKPKP